MAQSENYFGLRRGSTKTATYTVRHGKQITKDRVTVVTNPQTSEQMAQRIKVPIVAQASSVLHDIINHSFEGVPYGEQSINEFRSVNLKKGELTISSYVPKGAQDCGEADYIISKGSLNNVGFEFFGTHSGVIELQDADYPGYVDTDFPYTQEEFEALEIGSVFPDRLITYYTQKGMICDSGDQLTILIGKDGEEYSWINNNKTVTAKRHSFVVGRIVLSPSNAITGRWKLIQQFKMSEDGDVEQNAVWSDGYICLYIDSIEAEEVEMYFMLYSDFLEQRQRDRKGCMATIIRSQKATNNLWLRSTSRLYVGTSQKISAADVIATYKKTSNNSTQYLNSGVDGVGITGGNT